MLFRVPVARGWWAVNPTPTLHSLCMQAGKDAAALKSESHMLPKQTLEINPAHPIIVRLYEARAAQPDVARAVAEQVGDANSFDCMVYEKRDCTPCPVALLLLQIVDNALIAAGLIDDSRTMLPRLTALLELVLGVGHGYAGEAVIEGKRFVPERERDERAGIDLSAKLAEDLNAKLKEQDKS